MKKRNGTHGFTLIEVLLVVVIIGILAAIVAPKLVGRGKEAKVSAAQDQLKAFATALDMYHMDNDRYPTTEHTLSALIEKPSGAPEPKKWQKYLDASNVPLDPWGNEYVYRASETGDEYELLSVGVDGQEGTEDDVKRP